MKTFLSFLFTIIILISCSWTPDRDNPIDPHSPYYETPPQRNRPPEILDIKMITDCGNSLVSAMCAFEVTCRIEDPDRNVAFDSVQVRIDTLDLGSMSFDPRLGAFFLRKAQGDFGQPLDVFVGDTIFITVADDSGAIARAWTIFHEPVRNWPVLRNPQDGDEVFDYTPALSWDYWTHGNNTHRFSVAVLHQTSVVWDTSGLLPSDTSVVVTDSLRDSRQIEIEYLWHLTVTDGRGNRITSLQNRFTVLPPEDSLRRRRFGAHNVE